jgi:arginine repressor
MASALDLRDLKKVTNAILDHVIDDLKIEKVTIENGEDFYWEVPSDKLHAVKEPPPKLDVGRLADDWEFLQSILKDKDHAVALMLIHVAPLLRRIGEKIGQ